MSYKPVGYEYIRQIYKIQTAPHFRSSFITQRSKHEIRYENNREEHYYPPSYDPGLDLGSHIDFAFKYEGLDLGLFSSFFSIIDREELVRIIKEKPLGQYRRRLWFLFEYMTGEILPIPDLKTGNHISLADEDLYFTKTNPHRSVRHKIAMNLFGTRDFIPLIRKSSRLLSFQGKKLDDIATQTIKNYPADFLYRAVSYLYTKETKASFQIEREEPDHSRSERFITLLKKAEHTSFLNKPALIELQNTIVDERFAAPDYRDFQNYVGETHGFGKEKIHYVCPKPEDVESLMQGLLSTCQQFQGSEFDPVLFAAVASFGFVFIHPFDDGNGRIHRFLIHNILASYRFTPPGVIFPISASMLQQLRKYDETLESFSNPRLALVDYRLSNDGEMQVKGATSHLYRYIDFTFIAERLYEFIEDTVLHQLPEELSFLARYDSTRRDMRSIVEMPDRLVDLFIKCCTANNGRLSKAKRQSHFAKLTDDEIKRLEEAFARNREDFDREKNL